MNHNEPIFVRYLGVTKHYLVRMLEFLLVAAFAVLVLDVLWGVFSRYVLGEQSSWTEELARVLLIWVSLLGGALAYSKRAHLGLDIFVNHLDADSRKRVMIITDVVVLFFAVFVLIFGGGSLVMRTFSLGQMMMALLIPKGAVYLAVPISGLFFLIFSVEALIERFAKKNTEAGEALSQ